MFSVRAVFLLAGVSAVACSAPSSRTDSEDAAGLFDAGLPPIYAESADGGFDAGLSNGDAGKPSVDAGKPSVDAGPTKCTALGELLRCDGDAMVECHQNGIEVLVACSGTSGLVCRQTPGGPRCVHPVSRACTEVSARCDGNVALTCWPGNSWEEAWSCPSGLLCSIATEVPYATCAQPGAARCPFTLTCSPLGCGGGVTLDCCQGFERSTPCSEPGHVCVESTRIESGGAMRICLPPDYAPCDPTTFSSSCDGGVSTNCFNYVSTSTCAAPNGQCTVIPGPTAACLAAPWSCDIGKRSQGCVGGDGGTLSPPTHELVCTRELDGWITALPCPSGCACYDGFCQTGMKVPCNIGPYDF